MRILLVGLALLLAALAAADSPSSPSGGQATVIVVVGAAGEEEYGKNFEKWAALWEKASREAGANHIAIGLSHAGETNDLARLQQTLQDQPKATTAELWLVLLGHGTFDGKEAKFNLRGPDLSATELAAWLQPCRRPLAIINAAASGGPFLNKLSAPGRVLVTATRSGYEQNYARFGQYLAEAILDPQADLDKDGQISLLEAFLAAARKVDEFYKTEGRLATEHALLDDNGDGLGTPASWFRGIHAVKQARDGAGLDGLRAHQWHLVRSEQDRKLSPELRARRDELEVAIASLRESKSRVPEAEYYERLEKLLLELARLYEQPESSFE